MPLPVIADHFRTISEFTNIPAGKPWTVCMDYDASGAVGEVTDEAVAIAVGAAWSSFFNYVIAAQDIADRFMDDVSLSQVTVYDLTGDKAPWIETGFATVTGDGASPLPPDIALVISKRTATRGRRGRGRMFLGGLSFTAITPATGYVEDPASWAAAANAHLLNLTVGEVGSEEDIPMCVISQAVNPLGVSYPVDTLTVDQHFDVQRRRGRG